MLKQSQFNESEVPEATPATAPAKKIPAFLLNKPKRQNLAYPDYSRSLVSQRWQDPEDTARKFAIGSGAAGAALGMLISRVFYNKASLVGLGGVAGGAAGAALGYGAGRQSAESDNSRTLWMRRKPGINDPGELESALRYGERPVESIAPRVKRAAPNPVPIVEAVEQGAARVAPRIGPFISSLGPKFESAGQGVSKFLTSQKALPVAGRAVGGGLWGYYGDPALFDYQDEPGSRILGAGLGALTAAATGTPLGKGRVLSPKMVAALLAGEGLVAKGTAIQKKNMEAAEATTEAMKAQTGVAEKQVGAIQNQADATSELAKATKRNNLKDVLKSIATSNPALGTYAGLGVAGLGGLATGLTRPKTDEEIAKGTGRGKMIAKDFIQYALPLGLAGGVAGSLFPSKATA